jgi:CRP-like cAMP-binding protein
MSDEEIQAFDDQCEIVEFKKGDIMIKEGDTPNSLYFIIKGLIRNYVNLENGDIKIYNFRMENMQITGYAMYNYANSLKAIVNVECLEDCIMIKVSSQAINFLIENNKNGERLGRFMAEYHVMEMVKYVVERDTMPIMERYNNMEIGFPNIHQRVPQHMIASYLGITPVHLSNLKKTRKK